MLSFECSKAALQKQRKGRTMLETRTVEITKQHYESSVNNQFRLENAMKDAFPDFDLDMPEIDCDEWRLYGKINGRKVLLGDLEKIDYDLENVSSAINRKHKNIETKVKFPLKYTFKFNNPLNEETRLFSELEEVKISVPRSCYYLGIPEDFLLSSVWKSIKESVKKNFKPGQGYAVKEDSCFYDGFKDSSGHVAFIIRVYDKEKNQKFKAVAKTGKTFEQLEKDFKKEEEHPVAFKMELPKDCLIDQI